MWVFDGEEWVYEGGSSGTPAELPEEVWTPDMRGPELQIVEVPLVRHEQPLPAPVRPAVAPVRINRIPREREH